MDTPKDSFTDWTYVSYDKIPESPNKWNLTESDYRAFKKTDWVVTEKIHGANFCILTDGLEVRFAKRQELLSPDEDFFGFKSLEKTLVHQVQEIFKILQAEHTQPLIVSIYGELFGGEYPHPDVADVPNVQPVQTGIYYSPKIEYCAFDIAIEETGNPKSRTYKDYDKALKIFQQVGMLYTKPLFIGKYEEAVVYNLNFDSTIPTLLGLPQLPFRNKAEGIVIKPVKSICIDTPKGRTRPILKKKIPEFAEDSRFHQATKWTNQKASGSTQNPSTESELSYAMLALVTETRLNNAISKIGRVSASNKKRKQQLIELFVKDVLEAFKEEHETIFHSLSKKSQQTLLEQLNRESQKLVDNYFN